MRVTRSSQQWHDQLLRRIIDRKQFVGVARQKRQSNPEGDDLWMVDGAPSSFVHSPEVRELPRAIDNQPDPRLQSLMPYVDNQLRRSNRGVMVRRVKVRASSNAGPGM